MRSHAIGRGSILAVALATSTLHAGLVGQWRGIDYVSGENWTSTPGTGAIVANVSGSPLAVTDEYAAGAGGVDLFGGGYFIVPEGSNPLAGATEISLVAMFRPFFAGLSGGGFHQGSGLLGMEQAGVVNDWGLGWNGTRLGGGVPGQGVLERTIFTDNYPVNELRVVMLTWNGSTGVQSIYVNGVLANTQNTGVMGPRLGGAFGLGASSGTGANPFDGELAELRVYNSDEGANAATIASDLRDTYVPDVVLDQATATPTGGVFTLIDSASGQVDDTGSFSLDIDTVPVPGGDLQVSKSGGRTTITFVAPIDHGQLVYNYDLTVPLVGGGTKLYSATLTSHRLPLEIPGPDGAVGSWGIREILTGAEPLAPNSADIAGAVASALAYPASAEGSAPVLNHRDPDTNGYDSIGNFNNDFNLLTNDAGDQNFIVVAKTKVVISSPGEVHTFAIHSDDGFAMRVTGPGGGRFTDVGGDAQIDQGDSQTLFRDGGTGDSNSRGVYRFDSAGEYEILYLGYDGGSGGYHEVAWAPGVHHETRYTNTWRLVGDDTDPSIPGFQNRFVANPPGAIAEDGSFGVRTYLATGATGLGNMNTFLATTDRNPNDGLGTTIDAQVPYLNFRDPQDGAVGRFVDDQPFPGNTGNNDENVVTVAKARISIPSAGAYTFIINSDDGMFFRVKGVGGAPNPPFRRVTSVDNRPRFQMSNANEIYLDAANIEFRGIIDLDAGEYDIEYVTVENVGGFHYELGVAAGEWPHATTPTEGFQLVGAPAVSVIFPAVTAPGWAVESSIPGLNQFANSIAGAEARISYTQGLSTEDPIWATLGLDPANRNTTWPLIDFNDPQDGPQGSFTPTSPWPLNTGNADNDYAVRAIGNIEITQAGYYHLGFQGDDGGYMYLYGAGGNADPVIDSIVYTNHPGVAVIGNAPVSGTSNAIRVETGTGNSRTIVRTYLETGEYTINTLFWEGGGGSWWEVIGGSEAPGYNYPLLSTTGGSATVGSGLTLVAQPAIDPNDPNFAVGNVEVTGNPVTSVSFNIVSQANATYTVEASVDLETWIDVDTNVVSAGTNTPVVVDVTAFPELNGQAKVFFRAVLNE
nr:LamG domain-containing protein [Luteolibacter marinus]